MGSDRTLPRQLLILVTVLAALAAIGLATRSGDGTGEVRGLVTAVNGTLTDVASFDLVARGQTFTFVPAEGGDFDFPLPHLRDHLRGGETVVVTYATGESGVLLATSLSDG